MGANALAPLMLFVWAPVCLVLFARLRPHLAGFVSLTGAAMFLPANYGLEVPFLTGLDKEILPPIYALAGALAFARGRLTAASLGTGPEILTLLMAVGVVATSLTNGDALRYGALVLPGESGYDGVVRFVDVLLRWTIPYSLGRCLIQSDEELREVLGCLAVLGLGYSLFAIVELNMAPVMNVWVYGYHQSSFEQAIRGSGFRPKIFMRHGLNATFFLAIALVALAGTIRDPRALVKLPKTPLTVYMSVLLVFCKSVAAIMYAAAGMMATFFLPKHLKSIILIAISIIVVSYPMLRALEWVPTDAIVEVVNEQLGHEKQRSIRTRFNNEWAILEKAMNRPIFGWGGYGRARIYDIATGENLSVTDGFWAILIGINGFWGFFCVFGMFLYPVLRAAFRLRRMESGHPAEPPLFAMALIVLLCAADLIPNAGISAYLLFSAGALARAASLKVTVNKPSTQAPRRPVPKRRGPSEEARPSLADRAGPGASLSDGLLKAGWEDRGSER